LCAPSVGHLLLGASRRSNKTREGCCGHLVAACFVQWKYTIFPEDGPINPAITTICLLLAPLGTEHSVNGYCPSFWRDLGIYLETIGDDPEVIETFTFVGLGEKEVLPSWFSSF